MIDLAGSDATTATRDAGRGCPPWTKLLLILSLAANVAVAGLVIGHSLRGEAEPPRGTDRVIEMIVGLMPEQRRVQAVAYFADAQDEIAAARAERMERLEEVVTVMRAEPYDPRALLASLDAMFDRRYSGRAVIRERLATLLAELTADERAVFAERFAERLSDHGGRGN